MTRFSIEKKIKNMVLKCFILPEKHFKANLFFPRNGDTKRGKGGLIKVNKQVDFKLILGDFFFIKVAGWVGPDP